MGKIMETNVTVQLSESRQVDIPEGFMEFLDWQIGMELDIKITSSGLLIQAKKAQTKKRRLEELRGFFKHHGKPLSDKELCAPIDYRESK